MAMRGKLLLATLVVASVAGAVEIDGVVAKVGVETVLRSDVLGEMRRAGAGEGEYGEYLDHMIERKLILKAATESKMTMQEWVVESRVREVIQRNFDGDRNKLMDALAHDRVSYPEWYSKVKEDMIIQAMRWQVVDKNITASPSELRREYAEHPERYAAGKTATLSVILLKPEDAASRQAIDAALKSGEKFEALARRYSADSHAAEGGLWRDIDPADVFKPEVAETLAQLADGAISKWLDIDGWSFLIRRESMKGGAVKSFEEAFDAIDANVREAKAKVAYEAWVKRLRAETFVKLY